jgi:hypothetical protein
MLALASCLFTLAALPSAQGRPQIVLWCDSHPGMPPKADWRQGDTPMSLAHEMYYSNMKARDGSPWAYQRLREMGFDAVGLQGFEGPYRRFDPDRDDPDNLDHVMQTRNRRCYIKWARDAGLDVYLNIQFFRGEVATVFSWRDSSWERTIAYVRNIAHFAKRTGCQGLIFDFEPYDTESPMQWSVPYWTKNLGIDRAAFLELMRTRGAEFSAAIAAEFPECKLRVYNMGAYNNGEDGADVHAWFLAGLAEAKLPAGIELDIPNTYYRYDPRFAADTYTFDGLPMIERAAKVSRVPEYVRQQCTISPGSAPIHRWNSWDGMYTRAIARLTADGFEAHLLALLHAAPRSIWMCGEATFDWTMPELSDQVRDDPTGWWGEDLPYANMSERNKALGDTLSRVAHMTPAQMAARYDEDLKKRDAMIEERKRIIPRQTVAYLYNNDNAWIEPGNDWDWNIRAFWALKPYAKFDLAGLTRDLPTTGMVVSVASAIWADHADEADIAKPRDLPDPAAWKAFLERGGVLVLADLSTNPNGPRWLASISPDLALPGALEKCDPHHAAAWWNPSEKVVREPYRVRLFTCDRHLTWDPAKAGDWVILAKCPDGRPIMAMHRMGKGLVAVVMSSKFQSGFGWEMLVDLAVAARRGS